MEDHGGLGPWDRALGAAALLSLGWAVLSLAAPRARPTLANVRAEKAAAQARREAAVRRLQGRHPWAGHYLGAYELWVAPGAGFQLDVGADGETGEVQDLGGRLRLDYRRPEVYDQTRFTVVPWGGRVYLVQTDQLQRFVDAVNSGEEPRRGKRGFFLLREGDWDKPAPARPLLSSAYAAGLLRHPIEAKVTRAVRLGPGEYGSRIRVTLDAGASSGLRPGIKLYQITDHACFFDDRSVRVVSVAERSSQAIFDSFPRMEPRPGWRMSTFFHSPRVVDACGFLNEGPDVAVGPTGWRLADGYGQ